MRTIEVVAAIIVDGEKIFATQRGYGEFKDGWEFPGGKIEGTYVHDNDDDDHDDCLTQGGQKNCGKWVLSETPQEALRREIREELATEIEVGELLTTVEYDYPNFHLTMHCFMCKVISGDLVLLEHEAARWLSREELDSVNWLPADEGIIDLLKKWS